MWRHPLPRLGALITVGLLAATPAGAADIEGKFTFKGKAKEYQVTAGCATKDGNDSWISYTVHPGDPQTEAKNESFAPRYTTLTWSPRGGCTFKHTNLPASPCLVYAKVGDWYFDWKWVELKDAKAKLKVDFTYDPAQVGEIAITLTGAAGNAAATLVPLDAEGKVPAAEVAEAFSFSGRVELTTGKATLKGVRPGKYQLSAPGAKPVVIEVKAGMTAQVDLKAG